MTETTEGNGNVQALDRAGRPDSRVQPEAFARSGPKLPPQPTKPPFYKRPLVVIIGGIVVIGGTVVGVLWYLHARQYQTTDDAFIEADVTQVSPRIAGHVQKVDVTDNQEVAKGQTLVEIDPADLQAKDAEAEAALVAAQKALQQSRENAAAMEADVGQAEAAEEAALTESNRAYNELRRYESLSPQAVTQQQLINLRAAASSADAQLLAAKQKTVSAKAHVKVAESQIQVSEAQVEQAAANLREAALQLSYATISAPIDGHVTNRSVQQGDYVQVGQALIALVPSRVYVIANYKETQLDLMRPGQKVELTVDGYPGHTFHGTVDSIQRGSGAAFSLLPPENATGNYVKVVQRVPVKITFDSEGYLLGPGMSVVPSVKVR